MSGRRPVEAPPRRAQSALCSCPCGAYADLAGERAGVWGGLDRQPVPPSRAKAPGVAAKPAAPVTTGQGAS